MVYGAEEGSGAAKESPPRNATQWRNEFLKAEGVSRVFTLPAKGEPSKIKGPDGVRGAVGAGQHSSEHCEGKEVRGFLRKQAGSRGSGLALRERQTSQDS